jgi:putative holliday junction resolvase
LQHPQNITMRIVGIDFGLKRIGVAISNSLLSFAMPIGKVERVKDDKKTLQNLMHLLKEYKDITKFVIGLPLHLSGKESAMSLDVRKFATFLENETKIPVEFVDERLTSKTAEGLLREIEMKRKERKNHVDTLSATLILQTYLELISL